MCFFFLFRDVVRSSSKSSLDQSVVAVVSPQATEKRAVAVAASQGAEGVLRCTHHTHFIPIDAVSKVDATQRCKVSVLFRHPVIRMYLRCVRD